MMTVSDDDDLRLLLAADPKLAEVIQNLRKSERMMANAERIANFGCWEFDMVDPTRLEGNALRWSDEVFRIFGYEPGEIDVTIENFYRSVHPDDLAMVQDRSMQAYQTLTKISFDHRIVRPTGEIRWVHEDAEVSKDNISGRVLYVTGTVQDITTMKLIEFERAEASRALLARNADLERLAFMVSHDLRSPVTTVLSLAALLEVKELDENTKRECIAGLVVSARKIDETIMHLSSVFESDTAYPEQPIEVLFADVVRNVTRILALRPRDMMVTTDFSAAETIRMRKSYCQSIFQNLIASSVKHCRIGTRGWLHISSLRTDRSIVLSFKDDCSTLHLDNDMHRATDIGLYMVKAQVEAMGGTVSVRNQLGGGSEFIMEFPLSYEARV